MDFALLRLTVARACAWALLFAGWFTLGALGHAAARGEVGAALPLAVWLLAIGVLLVVGARVRWSVDGIAAAMVVAAAVSVAALQWLPAAPVLAELAALAVGWAVLLVLASRVVQALRRGLARPVRAPLWPAVFGACAAWAAAGDPLVPDAHAVAALLAGATALLVLLRPRGAEPVAGCRAGLFDCSLPLPAGAAWRVPADLPLHAAALSMLPMMAALPVMAEWCAAGGWSPRSMVALHLAAMLGPALLLAPWLGRWPRGVLRAVVAALLVAGAALLLRPDSGAPVALATLLHAAAWSLAWAAPMLVRERSTAARGSFAPLGSAGLSAAGVLALAAALALSGPAALKQAHLLLAALALLGVLPALRRG